MNENNINNSVLQNNNQSINSEPHKNDKKNNNNIYLIIVIILGILIILYVFIKIMINVIDNSYDSSNRNITDADYLNNECKVEPITIEGFSEAEKAYNKVTKGGSGSLGTYYSVKSINANEVDTYTKVSQALYLLGYFEDNAYNAVGLGCNLTKSKIDNTIKRVYSDINYSPSEFIGNNCLPFKFDYDSQEELYKLTTIDNGCGDGGDYIDEIYDEKIERNILTFKTKVLMYGDNKIYYYRDNDLIKIENSNAVNRNSILVIYNDYANVYEWTFVKNIDGEYVFDNIKRIK